MPLLLEIEVLLSLLVVLIPAPHSLRHRMVRRSLGGWLSIWNEDGKFWCEALASRNEPETALVKQVFETFRELETSGSSEIPVYAGVRDSDAW